MNRFRIPLLLLLALGLSSCGVVDRLKGRPTAAAPVAAEPGMATELAPGVTTTPLGTVTAHRPEALDTTSAAEKSAALAAPAAGAERNLGKTVVALGSPVEAGLWVASSLVSTTGPGRITAPNGKSLAVELRPASGASQMSLSAYQTLGIGLTELPEITLFQK